MTKNEIIKGYLRTRGLRVLDNAVNNLERYKNDVYENLSDEEIKERVDEVEIKDLDETVDDSAVEIENTDDKKEKMSWDINDNRFTVLSEEDTNEYGKSNNGN